MPICGGADFFTPYTLCMTVFFFGFSCIMSFIKNFFAIVSKNLASQGAKCTWDSPKYIFRVHNCCHNGIELLILVFSAIHGHY